MALTPGNWKIGIPGTVVSDASPADYPAESGHADVTYYGGFLLCESVGNNTDARLFADSKNILLMAAEVIKDINRSDLQSVRNLQAVIKRYI